MNPRVLVGVHSVSAIYIFIAKAKDIVNVDMVLVTND